MALSESGRFQLRRSFDSFGERSNPGSIHSNFEANVPPVSYEPGTGADLMHKAGWHNRDAYGNPYKTTKSDGSFGEDIKQRKNMTYIIPLIVISALLLIFLIAIILLFATGVFQFRKATPPPKPANPLDYVTERPAQDHLINRTFECEIFIKYQANAAYNDPTSIEYDQASLIIRNALNTLISQSTIRDLTPRIALEKLQNQGNDLRVPFRMTLLLLSNSRLTADSIQNVLLSELSLLEIQLNNTEIDRSRVHVRLVE